METNRYRGITWWRLEASAGEIAEIASKPEDLMRWWPATFLEVQTLQAEQEVGPGSQMKFHVKGWLPFTLRFEAEIQELVHPRKCSVRMRGDLEGQLDCKIREKGPHCWIRFDWKVRVEKPLVRWFSFPLKFLFYSNHLWVMLRGWQSLRLELAHRHARRQDAGDCPLALPGPAFPHGPRYPWLGRRFESLIRTPKL